ncbi:hypothetical protein G7009_01590 [Pseudomonas capeferrum]|uniref:ECs_2282 family putative zinc-binding protein n=1 Tax=Pseudomonas capeferrum TaxID=1495066 RepID=UPI0015E27343|nr:hypothetical protein [Pseudomonas capeferrum]MBA1200496.1 hypothetical protein [Pseudomonas capeferrum]
MDIKATCKACGSDKLVIPEEGESDQMVRCSDCSALLGSKQDIQQGLREAAAEQARKMKEELSKSLSKLGFKRR